ncbi:precorrin-6y C5,15-methyltransferase (decarboxylating) subunit CbiE [Siculibacillus lacustris]|uniref:Precorrin-6y C5,15-methyltransferase (Decarboxylating) subunit CbiE n=1 Tax=Siculibacillus lacustris TaxID=1549641 RepID=A0A4V2KT10_9HYPH|nr:precorrin-6y C5,15-methyltransferase (decarboxylating) subunit CbiE [Siculibacillus lacustris]TBW35229.1 precorrin-6y C5,15-methyltransferase (decarboxylating) subunit CbiE [Siculibacillus lacustris]
MTEPRTPHPWLAILGLGEDGLDGLSPAARRLLDQAELVVGGKRHLSLIGDVAAEKLAWPVPLTDAFPAILARRGRPVAVLASGDPFSYGVGSLIAREVSPAEYVTIPAPSAFSLAASRVGWAVQDCALVTLHGRAFEKIVPHLQPGRRILVLSWDGTTPGRLAAHLVASGMGRSRLIVLEAMGGMRERVHAGTAADFDRVDLDPLNTVAIEVVADAGARVLPRSPGLPDAYFDNDGQITKREIRAVTLAKLAPRHGELLWDVGAGTGSIAVEWMLADPANRAVAIEPRPDRTARIARNAAAFGVPDLVIVEGWAPAALTGLPTPDAIFLGGGGCDAELIDLCRTQLAPGGRLVANAVTLETQAEVFAHHARLGGELVQISIARAAPLGSFRGFRPAMPIVQWCWEKAGAPSGGRPGDDFAKTLDAPVDEVGDEPVDDPGENPGDGRGTTR